MENEYLDIIPQRKKRKVTIKAVFQRFPVQKVLHVYANGKEIPFKFEKETGIITITPYENLSNGYHTLNVVVQNKNGNHQQESEPFHGYEYLV